jgi:hypothetical protein
MKLFHIFTTPSLVWVVCFGCQTDGEGTRPQSSSVAHWLQCDTFSECSAASEAVACEDGYCVDSDGVRVGADAMNDDSTGEGMAADDATDDSPSNDDAPEVSDDLATPNADTEGNSSDDVTEPASGPSSGDGRQGALETPMGEAGGGPTSGAGGQGAEAGTGGGSSGMGGATPTGGSGGADSGMGGAPVLLVYQDEWGECESADECTFLPAQSCCFCELVPANRQFEEQVRATIQPYNPATCGDLGCAGGQCDPSPLATCSDGKCVAEPGCAQRTLDTCDGDGRCSLYTATQCPLPSGGQSVQLCESVRDPACDQSPAANPTCRVNPGYGTMWVFDDGCAPEAWTQECPSNAQCP